MASPKITASVVDTNATTIALTGDKNTLIQYFSNAKATMTVTSSVALNEDMYIIRNGDKTGYGKEHTFNNVESETFNFSAEDANGNIGTKSVMASMVYYQKLTCNIDVGRPDGEGNLTINCIGNYFNNSFGKVDNTLTVQYRYKVNGGGYGEWIDMPYEVYGGYVYSASADITGLNYQSAYVFEVKAVDKLMTVTSTSNIIRTLPLFHWGKDDFAFEVPVNFNGGIESVTGDTTFENLNVTGDMRLKGSGNYGNKLNFGDGDYCYISEPTDDVMEIHAKKVNFVTTDGVYIDDNEIPHFAVGNWTPQLSDEGATYTTRSGWYMKVDGVVTVGFYIKAKCSSGIHSAPITIVDLPYTPAYPTAGGGMCSGAYVSGGYTFQCFVAETHGEITTRVQACNNTSATNLSTSASGCNYRNGGGEITLSGTITFAISVG